MELEDLSQQSKAYTLSNPRRLEAMRKLFPSLAINKNPNDGKWTFMATPEQAQLYRVAVDAHIAGVENLEEKVGSSISAPLLRGLLSPTTKGLLYGLGVGVFTTAIVVFPIIENAVLSLATNNTTRDPYGEIRNYQLLATALSGFIGGTTGAVIGFYQSIKDRLRD